jgi:hypothetical protein
MRSRLKLSTSQDVFRVSFSTEIEGQLTTGGLGHIKFWKMAATFTGLKLQGELGKFGRTAISDIEGTLLAHIIHSFGGMENLS